jgi:hypothetical protein
MTLTVDEYVKTKIAPQHHDIVKALRDLVRDCAPNAVEQIAYDMPVWKAKKIFAYITPNKKGITFSFTHGADFEDKYGLLKGTAKASRFIKIKNIQDVNVNEAALRYYLQQALAVDAK